MQDTILAIAGKPGLYRLVSQGRGMLIVETVSADKKRVSVGKSDRIVRPYSHIFLYCVKAGVV